MKRPAITPAMRLQVLRNFGAIVLCQECGNPERIADVQLDHHLALIDGGSHTVEELRPLCLPCHKPKSALEHKSNSKAKRLSKARELHQAVVAGEAVRPKSRIPSRPFQRRNP